MKHVKEKWLEAFPKLRPIGVNKFFEILGPLLIGIELVKSSYGDEYKPYLIISSMWNSGILYRELESDLKTRLSIPNIYMSLNNGKGIEFNLGYYDHTLIPDAVSHIREQFVTLEQDMKITNLFNYLDLYRSSSKAASTSAGTARLLELKYLIVKYLGNKNLMHVVLQEIENRQRTWDMLHFNNGIGDYDLWFEKLKNISQEDLIIAVDNFKLDPKLKKLNIFKLIE